MQLRWLAFLKKCSVVAYLLPVSKLLDEPSLKINVVAICKWNCSEQREHPDQMAESTSHSHVCVNQTHEWMLDPFCKHAKALTKGEVPHDIKAVKPEPFRDVEGHTPRFFQSVEQLAGVFGNARFIIIKS